MKWDTELKITCQGGLEEALFDALAYTLADLEEADDAIDKAELTAALVEGWVLVTMTVEEANLDAAAQKTIAAIRSALHQIGEETPGREELVDKVNEGCMALRPVRDRAPV